MLDEFDTSGPSDGANAVGRVARSLSTLVANSVLQEILDGRLPPGTKLPETQLAEKHAVSRATVREALGQLERNHFVERLPRYGARVVQIDLDEIEELYELRAMLLGLASARAARLASDDQLQKLQQAALHLEQLARSDANVSTYTAAVLKVQDQLIALSQSKWVQGMYDQIAHQALWHALVRNNGMVFSTPERRCASAQDWSDLTTVLIARDVNLADVTDRRLIKASAQHVCAQYIRTNTGSKQQTPEIVNDET